MYLGQWTQGSAIPNRIPNHYRIVLTSTPPPPSCTLESRSGTIVLLHEYIYLNLFY